MHFFLILYKDFIKRKEIQDKTQDNQHKRWGDKWHKNIITKATQTNITKSELQKEIYPPQHISWLLDMLEHHLYFEKTET